MKKAIAAILADTHLKEDNIEINKSIYRESIQIVKDLGLTQLDHAGDIFNSRKAQTQVTLDAFDDIVTEIHNAGIQLNVVVGNHDKTDYGSEVSFVKQFRYHPSVNIHNVYGYRSVNDKIDIHYLSFFSDDVYVEKIKNIAFPNTPKKHILLTHIGIAGAVMNNGIVIESESITPSLFKKFDLTLVGHFHDAQVLADGKIKYIGASLQHTFGELTDKGLTILYDDLSTEIISLKYPQYISFEVNPKDITLDDVAQIKAEKEESGNNIRIVLVGTDADINSFNKQVLIDAGVSVTKRVDSVVKEELEERVQAFDVVSLKEEFDTFCKKNKLDQEQGMKYFNSIIAA